MIRRDLIKKRLLALGLAVVLAAQAAGCGSAGQDKKTESTAAQQQGKAFVYTAEYRELPEDMNINAPVVKGNSLYYSDISYDEETKESQTYIYRIDLGQENISSEALPVPFEPDSYLNQFCLDNSGNFIMVEGIAVWKDEEKTELQETKYFLRSCSADGQEQWRQEITDLGKDQDHFYIMSLAADQEGNIYAAGERSIWVFDPSGNLQFEVQCDNWIRGMTATPKGTVVASYWGNQGECVLSEIDFSAKAFGKTYQNFPEVSNGMYPGMQDGNTILCDGNGRIYEYDLEAEQAQELINWIDVDVNSDHIQGFAPLEDGRLLALQTNYENEFSKSELIYLTRKDASDVTQKAELTLGTMYLDSDVKSNVIRFNKTNDKYRIVIKEYGVDSPDWEVARTNMNNDIITGQGPDIMNLDENAGQYISKGILEDLTPYIDGENGIKRDEYLDNVFKAYEREGKIYGLAPSFSVFTVMGRASDVGATPGWSTQDVMDLLKSKPEGTRLMPYTTRDTMMNYCCTMALDQYVNWETGECSFDSEEFIKILEFCASFPENSDGWEESVPAGIQSGEILLQDLLISDVISYQMYSKMYGEPVTFIGYPTADGTPGNYLSLAYSLGISSKSENKEGAWEFVKSFFSDEYQKQNIRFYFPAKKSALDEMLTEAATEEYDTDEQGNQVKRPKTTWSYDDFTAEIFAAEPEQIDAVRELIENTKTVMSFNTEINNIITEETGAFFSGQKNAKDVAQIIQSRVQLYVNENR